MLLRLMPMVDRLCSMARVAGLQDAHGAQHDEGGVEAQHKAVVCATRRCRPLAMALRSHQLSQTVGRDGDVRDLAGNGSAVVDGNADVGGGQGGGVVDAVADHDDGVALGLGLWTKLALSSGSTSAK